MSVSEPEAHPLVLLSTGVPGLDTVLGGGMPEYSLNLILGVPGAGKTTLIHQLTFANATVERPALYFTIVGEPALKMLRFQQQMSFFEREKIGTAIRFVDLSDVALKEDLDNVLDKIMEEVSQINPAIVVVDSFRTLVYARRPEGRSELQSFLQRLALSLASWQATSFLIAEYGPDEMHNNPVLTIADSIIILSQSKERNSIVRKLEVMKMRGMASIPGVHTFRISSQGIHVFPRATSRMEGRDITPRHRARFGIPELDDMLGGGIPAGDATIITGPSGTGKTVLSTHVLYEGMKHGESAVLAVFEEQAEDYVARACDMGFDLAAMMRAGRLQVLQLRPLDLSADEILHQIKQVVVSVGASRLVIDSLNGVELALAPTFREDFRESLYRMVGGLTGGGASVVLTVEVPEAFDGIHFSPHGISFLAQNIVFLRYIELDSQLRKLLAVVKMRRSAHSRELREYEITSSGLRVHGKLSNYSSILSGTPVAVGAPASGTEDAVLQAVITLDEATEDALIAATGIPAVELVPVLRRLVEDSRVAEVSENGRTLYRPLGRPKGLP